jgi:hypothetical protein
MVKPCGLTRFCQSDRAAGSGYQIKRKHARLQAGCQKSVASSCRFNAQGFKSCLRLPIAKFAARSQRHEGCLLDARVAKY